jgi:acetyl esterase/lipase
MTFRLNAEVAAAMSALGGDDAATAVTWQSLRAGNEALYPMLHRAVPKHPGVRREVFTTKAADGTALELHWFGPGEDESEGSGVTVLHAHGGGRVAGSVELYAPFLADFVARSGVPLLSVEYRRAPEAKGTIPTEDVYAGLSWLVEHAPDPSRIVVMGDSGGAGLVAGVTLLARERGVEIAGQMLIYPMLDDRTAGADEHQKPFNAWLESANAASWDAVLQTRSAVEVPGRNTDFSGLPRAYLEVGELDLFRAETLAYANGLWSAGVSAELHVLPGAPHGFDHWTPTGDLTDRALAARTAFVRSL